MSDAQTIDVRPLDELPDLELAEDSVDVRGWEVTTPAYSVVGTVTNLLVDVRLGRVRYLEVELSGDSKASGRCMLLPIGKARIDDALDRIVVSVPSCLDSMVGYDTYDSEAFTRDFEQRVLESLGEQGGPDGDFYSCPAFDDSTLSRTTHATRCGRRSEDGGVGACAAPGASAAAEPPGTVDTAGTAIRVVPADDDEDD